MKPYNIEWSHEAIYDAADIADYIEDSFGYERSKKFEDDIKAEVGKLSEQYQSYTGVGIFYRGYLIHRKPFPPSLIFYIVDNNTETVSIIRILRHEQNWQETLRNTLFYTFD